jgi:hypothetical protein
MFAQVAQGQGYFFLHRFNRNMELFRDLLVGESLVAVQGKDQALVFGQRTDQIR